MDSQNLRTSINLASLYVASGDAITIAPKKNNIARIYIENRVKVCKTIMNNFFLLLSHPTFSDHFIFIEPSATAAAKKISQVPLNSMISTKLFTQGGRKSVAKQSCCCRGDVQTKTKKRGRKKIPGCKKTSMRGCTMRKKR